MDRIHNPEMLIYFNMFRCQFPLILRLAATDVLLYTPSIDFCHVASRDDPAPQFRLASDKASGAPLPALKKDTEQ